MNLPERARYTVYVDDNFHFMDEGEGYVLGEFETADAAVAAAKEVIDRYLAQITPAQQTAEQIFRIWSAFGDTPLIFPPPPVPFQAREYCRKRCEQISAEQTGNPASMP